MKTGKQSVKLKSETESVLNVSRAQCTHNVECARVTSKGAAMIRIGFDIIGTSSLQSETKLTTTASCVL